MFHFLHSIFGVTTKTSAFEVKSKHVVDKVPFLRNVSL